MSEWVNATVGDVTEYQKAGGTPPVANRAYYGGPIPFVVIEDITRSGKFLETTSSSLSQAGIDGSAAWFIRQPHVLYSMYATVGKPIINQIECATNQAIIALKENRRVGLEYLYYWLLFIRPTVWKYTAQTTQSNLNAQVVRRLPISYPTSHQAQSKIVAVLSAADQAIEKTESLIEKYQQIKAGLMHDLFTRGIGADGKLRPPREQAPELYQETPIGWIPVAWGAPELFGARVDVIDPNPSHRYPPAVQIGYPICSTENFIGEDEYDTADSKLVPESVLQEQQTRCGFRTKDVVFARKGKIGFARRYGDEKKVFSHTVVVMKPKTKSLDYDWLLWLARSRWFLYGIEVRMNTNSGVPTLGVEFIKGVVVPFPDEHEQAEVAARLDAVAGKITALNAEMKKQREIKAGLMHDLLSGAVQLGGGVAESANV